MTKMVAHTKCPSFYCRSEKIKDALIIDGIEHIYCERCGDLHSKYITPKGLAKIEKEAKRYEKYKAGGDRI